jgi:hypothetical protein
LYTSSKIPIIKARLAAAKSPVNALWLNKLMDGFRKRYKIINPKKLKNKLIPPKDGLDWLLQRTVISFLFRIPKEAEKLISRRLKISVQISPLAKKIK